MAEAFKEAFNEKLVQDMARHLRKQWPDFDATAFVKFATQGMQDLELKQRSYRITQALQEYLPADFEHAGDILLNCLGTSLQDDLSTATIDRQGIAGWAIMPMSHYVGLQGLDHFEQSMKLLKEMTKRFTSEFAIRFFLLHCPKKTLAQLKKWCRDPDQHVRRLVSEGTRPRLPWAMQLPQFIQDPGPVLELLQRLKNDEKEYVRRSVANNLNDIAKDHPDTVSAVAADWLNGASPERKRMIRHACRSLLKNGHKPTLRAFGYEEPRLKQIRLHIDNKTVRLGGHLCFSLFANSACRDEQELMLDYVVHHQKSNGKTSPKVFKWRTLKLKAKDQLDLNKKHPMRKVTTRVYYPGEHMLEILVNGVSVAKGKFHLKV